VCCCAVHITFSFTCSHHLLSFVLRLAGTSSQARLSPVASSRCRWHHVDVACRDGLDGSYLHCRPSNLYHTTMEPRTPTALVLWPFSSYGSDAHIPPPQPSSRQHSLPSSELASSAFRTTKDTMQQYASRVVSSIANHRCNRHLRLAGISIYRLFQPQSASRRDLHLAGIMSTDRCPIYTSLGSCL
jgi:hypothetical protein